MSAPADKALLIEHWEARLVELLQTRNNLDREDLEYLAEKAASLKDARLQHAIGVLIGWDDDSRADLETFCAIALETMKLSRPSLIREASRRVELTYHLKALKEQHESEKAEVLDP